MLCGDVNTNRELNEPIDNFMVAKDQCLTLDNQDFLHTSIAHHEFLSLSAKGLILLRLHFVVHSFMNLYVLDPKTNKEVVGTKIRKFNQSTIQSHKVTIDKKICEFNLKEGLRNFDASQASFFRRNEGLLVSDFDDFMPENNQIVASGWGM